MVRPRTRRREARGQALTELVLGLAVFVTVLIFGLHFAEVSHLSLKTHEAMAAAAWDATAYRVERPGPNGTDPSAWYDVNRFAAARVNVTVNDRYADWDGRQSTVRGTAPTQVFTRAQGLLTTCTRNLDPANTFVVPDTLNAPHYGEPGALSCSTRGAVSTLNIPRSFLQDADDGFFTSPHVVRTGFSLCGLGRAAGGAECQGTLSLLLGDHGLSSGEGEEEECALLGDDTGATCVNRSFYNIAHNTWDRSMGWTGAPEAFARTVTGSTPKQRVTGFYLSFRGEERNFTEINDGAWQAQPMDHNTAAGRTGTYRQAYNASSLLRGATTRFVYLGRYTCD